MHLGHRGHRLRGADDALGLAGRAAGVGDRDDVVGRQGRGGQRLRLELGGLGGQVGGRVRLELGRHRPDREDLGQAGALLEQRQRALDEVGVDRERGDAGVVDDVGVVVGASRAGAATYAGSPGSARRPRMNSTSGWLSASNAPAVPVPAPRASKACTY